MARLLVDVAPLRESKGFRLVFAGQLVSTFGSQLTVVAVPYQVFVQTRSSLMVGLVSLAQFVPLLIGSLAGGALVDAVDRRKVLVVAPVAMGACSAGLAVNALLAEPAIWPLFVFTALQAGVSGVERPARSAAIPSLVEKRQLPAAYALWQTLMHTGGTAGPALAGVLLAAAGLSVVYWIDVASFGATVLAAVFLPALPPAGGGRPAGLASIVEGLRFLRGRRLLTAGFLVDLNAMVFGLPRALFPALAIGQFGGGPSTVGLLFAAPGAGALVGSFFTGWVGSVRRQGRAVLVSVAVWGAAIAGFGATTWLWLALALLAVAGAADVVSAVFRNTILQTTVPDQLRGRLSATHIAVVTGGPRLGDAESGLVAALAGTRFSVVSGGLLCLLGLLLVHLWAPELDAYEVPAAEPVDEDGR